MLRRIKPIKLMLLLVAVVGMLQPVSSSSAAALYHHPRYLHARSDLRAAYIIIGYHDEENVMRHANAVRREITAAIYEIDHAAVLDRKDIDDHPHVDTNLDRGGRFRKCFALLRSARKDIAEEEDNPDAIGWRNAAYRHIDAALDQLRRAAEDLRIDRLEEEY
ncbi:MAG TPA: hypothetical protein VEZ90_05890 [Blastocatellia bacterium]|nr:hypothetical protein [Blastocatellia bacterium]